MNILFLGQKLGDIKLGQLDSSDKFIERINHALNNSAHVDENTTGLELERIYFESDPEIKSILRSTDMSVDFNVLDLLNDIERLKANMSILQEKDDTIKDAFGGAVVLVLVAISVMLISSYLNSGIKNEDMEGSKTLYILTAAYNLLKHFLGAE